MSKLVVHKYAQFSISNDSTMFSSSMLNESEIRRTFSQVPRTSISTPRSYPLHDSLRKASNSCPILKQEGVGFGAGSEPIVGKKIGHLGN
jgi:hypothetical protein